MIHSIPKVKGNPYLIPGKKEGAPLVGYAKKWAKLCKSVGIKGLHVHDLRRFFASAGLSNGVGLSPMGEILGHASAQTTKIYAFLMSDEAQENAERAATKVRKLMRPVADEAAAG